jgi:acyl-coenzyme A thioesterase PaaI-like protein
MDFQNIKETFYLRLFGLTKIPLLFMTAPSVLQLNDERCAVQIPLNKLTKNHLGSMYFGVLSMGADCAGGMLAMHHIRKSGENVSLVFKDFHADFLKRPEEAVIFTCDDGPAIANLVKSVIDSGERQHLPLNISAWAASRPNGEPVAKFVLTLSLKKKKS